MFIYSWETYEKLRAALSILWNENWMTEADLHLVIFFSVFDIKCQETPDAKLREIVYVNCTDCTRSFQGNQKQALRASCIIIQFMILVIS